MILSTPLSACLWMLFCILVGGYFGWKSVDLDWSLKKTLLLTLSIIVSVVLLIDIGIPMYCRHLY